MVLLKNLARFKGRTNLLWVTTIERPMAIEEIGKTWGYSSHIPLYKDGLPKLLVDAELWKITNVENRKVKYISIFSGYFSFLDLFPKSRPVELVLKDKDTFKEFFEKDEVRRTLFRLDAVKTFFMNDSTLAQKLGHTLPIIALSETITLVWFAKNGYLTDKNLEIITNTWGTFSGTSIFVDLSGYLQKAFAGIKVSQLLKWEYLLETNFGKYIVEESKKKINTFSDFFKKK